MTPQGTQASVCNKCFAQTVCNVDMKLVKLSKAQTLKIRSTVIITVLCQANGVIFSFCFPARSGSSASGR